MLPIEIFAALALAAAGGLRTSLTLFVLAIAGLEGIPGPLTTGLANPWIAAGLGVWALIELVASRTALGQRLVQAIQFFTAPVVGAAMAMLCVEGDGLIYHLALGVAGAALAATLQAVYMGYFFRRGRIPAKLQTLKEILCAGLVLLALDAPLVGGMVVLGLLWWALQQAHYWRNQFNRPGELCLN